MRTDDEKAIELFIKSLKNGDMVVETCPNTGLDYNSKVERGVLELYKSRFAPSQFMKELLNPIDINKTDKFKEYIKDSFEINTIEERFKSLVQYYRRFISTFEDERIANCISINHFALEEAVTSYYVDTKRLKDFHQIYKTNVSKVYGYMSYWLLKCKPLQVNMSDEDYQTLRDMKEKLSYLNEKFLTGYIINGILAELDVNIYDAEKLKSFETFENLLLYTLKYRDVTAKCLELMISSFLAAFSLHGEINN